MKNVFRPKGPANWTVSYWMPMRSLSHQLILKVEDEITRKIGSSILNGLEVRHWDDWEPVHSLYRDVPRS